MGAMSIEQDMVARPMPAEPAVVMTGPATIGDAIGGARVQAARQRPSIFGIERAAAIDLARGRDWTAHRSDRNSHITAQDRDVCGVPTKRPTRE